MYFANNKVKGRVLLLLSLMIAASAFGFIKYVESVILPRGGEALHSYAETNMFEILNSTITEVVDKYSLKHDNLVDIKYTNSGAISAISVNYVLANKIKSEISMLISQKLSEQDEYPVYVPMGVFSKNMYFMGKGPKIKFILMQRGCIQTDFSHTFESAGVNQTMHTLKIVLDADVALMLPFYSTHTNMTTSAVLSQTIINGECPEQILRLSEGES